ncbi:MAG TPA: NUDIX domain-containing protein [Gemmatimonadaceae bacterium]
MVPQAGAIVIRLDGVGPRILLVRARSDPNHWIFPKGHIERGESAPDAALREAREEAGVAASVIAGLGAIPPFQSNGEMVLVEYFLLRRESEVAAGEGREKVWLSPGEALRVLTHRDARMLLARSLSDIELAAASLPNANQDRFTDLVLAEHAHAAASFLASEADGERRATVFLAAIGSGVAVLGWVFGQASYVPGRRYWLAVALLCALLGLGLLTRARLEKRNENTDKLKNALARLRKYFLDGESDPRAAVLTFNPYEKIPDRELSVLKPGGGWVEVTILLNALLVGSIVLMLAPFSHAPRDLPAAVLATIVAWFWPRRHAMRKWLDKRRNKQRLQRMAPGE